MIYASDLDGNTARYGGAIHNQFSNSELQLLDGTVIRNNQAQFQGGGIYNADYAIAILTGVTLSNNRATDEGGGIFNSGSVTLTDSSLFANSASAGVGGAVYNEQHIVWFLLQHPAG